ncbi:hypothetical protein B0H12DRAFT_1077279 [Mycena haematopus]|nr:hypothetical protein B0H12DRAFT_1077279 [Mycena haematopus]
MPATSTGKRFKAHESQIDEGKLVLEELSTITDQVHIGSLPQVACMSCIILGKKCTPVAFGSQCGNCYNSSTSYCSYNTDAKFVVDTVRRLGPWMGASPEFFREAVHELDEAISASVAARAIADEAALRVAKWFSRLSTGAIALIDKFGPAALFQCFDDKVDTASIEEYFQRIAVQYNDLLGESPTSLGSQPFKSRLPFSELVSMDALDSMRAYFASFERVKEKGKTKANVVVEEPADVAGSSTGK